MPGLVPSSMLTRTNRWLDPMAACILGMASADVRDPWLQNQTTLHTPALGSQAAARKAKAARNRSATLTEKEGLGQHASQLA